MRASSTSCWSRAPTRAERSGTHLRPIRSSVSSTASVGSGTTQPFRCPDRNARLVHELLEQGADARGTERNPSAPNPVECFFDGLRRIRHNAAIPMSYLEIAVAKQELQITTDLLD